MLRPRVSATGSRPAWLALLLLLGVVAMHGVGGHQHLPGSDPHTDHATETAAQAVGRVDATPTAAGHDTSAPGGQSGQHPAGAASPGSDHGEDHCPSCGFDAGSLCALAVLTDPLPTAVTTADDRFGRAPHPDPLPLLRCPDPPVPRTPSTASSG